MLFKILSVVKATRARPGFDLILNFSFVEIRIGTSQICFFCECLCKEIVTGYFFDEVCFKNGISHSARSRRADGNTNDALIRSKKLALGFTRTPSSVMPEMTLTVGSNQPFSKSCHFEFGLIIISRMS